MDFDIVVVGGGLVGASFALAMKQSRLRVALVDARVPDLVASDDWDSRIYAISPGSAAFLDRCGAWAEVDSSRVCQVDAMRVFGDDGHSRLDFNSEDGRLANLAFIAESRNLLCAMNRALESQENLVRINPAKCRSLAWDEDSITLELDDAALRARLIVGADGRDSWVRHQSGFEAAPRSYGQVGVVANFIAEKPHRDIAWQWFKRDGILAFLPLPGNRVSMVWSTRDEHAAKLLELSDDAFCESVAEASASALGRLELITPPAGFPLRLLRLDSLVKPRIALIGDAAHNTHPLAGQGVNLGFRDARELSKVLCERGPRNDCGDYSLLRQYDRARKEDILSMQLATDLLQKLFNNSLPGLSALRNLGLRAVDSRSMIKSLLAQHAIA